ncbi:MAG: hypothetical protein M3Z92_07910 [Bacteroidota bacterium]|nr:hypothetical protein [Bacteroidota bacterium]
MNDTAIIIIALTLGFTLLVVVIRFLPFGQSPIKNLASSFYKIDLAERKVTAVTFHSLKEDTRKLFDNGYELIKLPGLKALVNHETKLPERSFFVALNDSCIYTLLKTLPFLIANNVSIIIFIPFDLVANKNKSEAIQNQLIDFIFSDETKKKFTIPN